jgi:hypothetical protein
VRADICCGLFVYRLQDTALSRRRDGFDSHTGYLRKVNQDVAKAGYRAWLGAKSDHRFAAVPEVQILPF